MVKHFACDLPCRYFCLDESRWGLKTLTGRVITAQGVKPTVSVQWPRKSVWLYGAYEPASSDTFFYTFSHLDGVCFNRFLEQFAMAFPDTLNLLQMDQASAHITAQLQWPENLVPLYQPSHSPELNPVERLWQELRKFFKGKSFAHLSHLQEALFAELNGLSRPTVASLTGYSFILDALPI